MRLALLVTGFALGVAVVFMYVWRAGSVEAVRTRALPTDPPVLMTLGEPFLTALARKSMADSSTQPPISNIVVETEHDTIVITGIAKTFGYQSVAVAKLHPVLRNGQLRIDVVSTELGDLPVPMETMIEVQINTRLRALLADLPVTITGVSVEPNRGLTVTFRVDLDSL